VQDLKELFAWLAARPEVNRTRIGGGAISYGGGALWLAAVQGVPFAALEIVASWTDFESAIFPQGLVKSGVVFGFLNAVPPERLDPAIVKVRDALLANATDGLHDFAAARSARPLLGQLKTPVFLAQGRRDFAFDIDQAVAAYRRLAGPKRLYVGDLGHAPAGDPEAEVPHYLTEGKLWFDRFLKADRNGIDTRPPVEVAPDPWTGKTVSYAGLPPTKTLTLRAAGTETIARDGKSVRRLTVTRSRIEEFGAPVVQVAVKPSGGWSRLVAVLSARTPSGSELVVSEGGAAVAKAGTLSIRLLSLGTLIPKGSRLLLTLAESSTAQDPTNLLYLDIQQPESARLTIGSATVRIPVLQRPISR
jgi:hypothetical protein